MLKLLVFGHSDSDGSRLANAADGWTWLVDRAIREDHGVELETIHRLFFVGPTATSYLERELERVQPNVVILGTSLYSVIVQLASNRIRQRFGNRAGNFVNRQEVRVAHLSNRLGPVGRARLMRARKVARRVAGTQPTISYETAVTCYEECLRILARHEDVHTIVFGGLGYSLELQNLNPRLNEQQDAFHARLKRIADECHFDWVTHEDILGGRVAKLGYMQADGVHSNQEGQRLAAGAVLPLVLARL